MPRLEIYTPKGFKEDLIIRATEEDMSISEYLRFCSDFYDKNKDQKPVINKCANATEVRG